MTIERPVAEPAALPAPVELDLPYASPLAASSHEVAGSVLERLIADTGPGERLQRLRRRQRLMREELLAVLVLLLVLAATVAVLATQWLSSGTSTNAVFHLFSGGST